MRDQVFSGRDVPGALEAAAQALGLPGDAIRYVVLDPGSGGGLGLSATPARIAVLAGLVVDERRPGGSEDARDAIRNLLRVIVEAGGLDVIPEIEEGEGRLTVRLSGRDAAFWLQEDAAALKALEHLLQRAFQTRVRPSRLVVDCEGFRELRDGALRQQAQSLAAEVQGDRRPRETPPLNSYERRIIHMTLAEMPGVRTFSVGEGSDRRVTIAVVEHPDDDNRGNR